MRTVSIHARAWRATFRGRREVEEGRFQFTPARGGRRDISIDTQTAQQFQFTPARGGRLHDQVRVLPVPVSIHARAWRATI